MKSTQATGKGNELMSPLMSPMQKLGGSRTTWLEVQEFSQESFIKKTSTKWCLPFLQRHPKATPSQAH